MPPGALLFNPVPCAETRWGVPIGARTISSSAPTGT